MDNFMKGQDPIMDPPTLQKHGLEVVTNPLGHRGQAGRTNFSKVPLQNVDYSARPKVSDVRCPNYFGDKGNDAIVYTGHT